jgi:hypothetical protein
MLFYDMHKNYTNSELNNNIIVCRATFLKWLKNIKVQGSKALKLHKCNNKIGSKKY